MLRSWLMTLISPVLTKDDLKTIEERSAVEGEAIAEARIKGLATGLQRGMDRFTDSFRGVIETTATPPVKKLPEKTSLKRKAAVR